jgi:hypothetical protein
MILVVTQISSPHPLFQLRPPVNLFLSLDLLSLGQHGFPHFDFVVGSHVGNGDVVSSDGSAAGLSGNDRLRGLSLSGMIKV